MCEVLGKNGSKDIDKNKEESTTSNAICKPVKRGKREDEYNADRISIELMNEKID